MRDGRLCCRRSFFNRPDPKPLEFVNAGVATLVGLIALFSAYTSIVQQFDDLRAGQKVLESGLQSTRADMRDLKTELKAELRESHTLLGFIMIGGFVSVGYVVRRPD